MEYSWFFKLTAIGADTVFNTVNAAYYYFSIPHRNISPEKYSNYDASKPPGRDSNGNGSSDSRFSENRILFIHPMSAIGTYEANALTFFGGE